MKIFKEQIIPLALSAATFLSLISLLYFSVHFLNLFPIKQKIIPQLIAADILIGLTIYLKTSVDFAIFIGNLIQQFHGWKNRIAIETGTAIGNGIGTLLVLVIWTFFKEIRLLMIIMILLASLVLFRMAQDGLQESRIPNPHFPQSNWGSRGRQELRIIIKTIYTLLKTINSFFDPLIKLILPHPSMESKNPRSFIHLLLLSFSIPFILGLDDFAGYIPLFSIVNVVSFTTGVFLGHMILNISLFAVPKITARIVTLPIVILLGSLAFMGIGIWGLIEALLLSQR